MHTQESACFRVTHPVTHHLPICVRSSGTAFLGLRQHTTEYLVGIPTGGLDCFVLRRRRDIGVSALPHQSLAFIGLRAVIGQAQPDPALPQGHSGMPQLVEASTDPSICSRTTHSHSRRRNPATLSAIEHRPERHLSVHVDSKVVTVPYLPYVPFPGRQPGRGEPQLGGRLGCASAFMAQMQISFPEPAIADLLVDAGFPGGRFETMPFLDRTQKPDSCC